MSLFKKKQSQVIKFGQDVDAKQADDNEILFVRVQADVTDPDARFEVPSTHEAIVEKGGGDIRPYPSGNYDVFDDKKEFKKLKGGLSVDIIYIAKDTKVLVNWGTPNRFPYRDSASNKVISIGARGELRVKVFNSMQFAREIVGRKRVFNLDEFKKQFRETIVSKFTSLFKQIAKNENLTYDEFVDRKDFIADKMCELLKPEFQNEFGLTVSNFKISAIDLLEDEIDEIKGAADEKQKQDKLKEYLAEVERLDDKQWEREKYLRQLELQDKNAYYEVMKVVGSAAAGNVKKAEDNKCPNCGAECKSTDKFCPRCGKRVSKDPIICPDCGKANDYNAMFCGNCGKKLVGDK